MICPTCRGERWQLRAVQSRFRCTDAIASEPLPYRTERVPCPDCGGFGITHCCDGLIEQEEHPWPTPSS